MITQAQYIASRGDLHDAYFLEIAQESSLVLPVPVADVCAALALGDEYLASISFDVWYRSCADQFAKMQASFAARGDVGDYSSGICALKSLARHLARREQSS